MPASHSILVSASVIHLSPQEKKQAIQSLLILGLSRYANNSGGSTSIDLGHLQRLHARAILELGDSSRQLALRERRPKTGPAGIKQSSTKDASCPPLSPPLKPQVPVRTKNVEPDYHPRPDATSHYPFLDSKATAESVLTATTPTPAIYSIGVPQRKRIAQRVWAEACQTAAGLRLADVPEALRALGIHLPRDLERAFLLRALTGAGAGVGGAGAGAAADEAKATDDAAAAAGLSADPVLSCQQWLVLVDRYVDREHRLAALRCRGDALLRGMGGSGAELGEGFGGRMAAAAALGGGGGGGGGSGGGGGGGDEDAVIDALLALEPSASELDNYQHQHQHQHQHQNQQHADDGDAPDLARAAPGRDREHAWPISDEIIGAGYDTEYQESASGAAVRASEAYDVAFHAALGRGLMQAKQKLASRNEQSKAAAAALAPTDFETAHHHRLRQQVYGTAAALTRAPTRAQHRPLIVRTNNALRLRQVHSRIAADVQRDRRSFQHAQELETSSSMTAIARQRVAALGVSGMLSASQGGGLGEGFDPSSSRLVGTGALASAGSSLASDPRGRYADLGSGKASTAIADSFLSSAVGRQLLPDKAELATYSLREAAAAAAGAGAGSGLSGAGAGAGAWGEFGDEGVDEVVRREMAYLLGDAAGSGSAGSAGSAGAGGAHKTVRERYLELQGRKQRQEEGQGQGQEEGQTYKGWKEAKGGVVADFGPPRSRYSDWARGPIVR